MRNLLRGVLFGGALMAAGTAMADVPASAPADMEKAALTLLALSKENPATAPRLADAKAKEAFATLTDRTKMIGDAPYSAKDIPPLQSAFGGYFALSKLYMNHKDPTGQTSYADNEFTYQDELTRLAASMLDAGGALSQALSDDVGDKPASDFSEQRKTELAKLRMGITQMFTGGLTILKNPRYSKENKLLIAETLANNAIAFRDIITVPERLSISGATTETLTQTPPEAAEAINTFASTMKTEECTRLCALK